MSFKSLSGRAVTLKEIKEFPSFELCREYIARIAERDSCEGGTNSIAELNRNILFEAEAKDLHPEDKILHGIPVVVKDNISTADCMHTTGGSIALRDHFAAEDAFVAKKLREAGALILAKANMTEFANFMTQGMSNGYSSRGGQVINAQKPGMDASGSSTGSAVAAAMELCWAAVGTETAGSIISPSMANGVCGLKPSIGLVSRTGILPISSTLDTAGPIARNLYDVAVLLGVIAGYDERDPATEVIRDMPIPDYTQALQLGVEGLRIGVVMTGRELEDWEKEAIAEQRRVLEEAGAVLVDGVSLEFDLKGGPRDLMRYEIKTCLNKYLEDTGITLEDIIRYNQEHYQIGLKYGQSYLLDAENVRGDRMVHPEYLAAVLKRLEAQDFLRDAFIKDRLDVIWTAEGYVSGLAPFTGFPALTLPVAKRPDGTLKGCYLIGRPLGEETLLRVGRCFEENLLK